jgi:hypothetical protein
MEGARLTGYRFVAMCGIRDPRMIAELETVQAETRKVIERTFKDSIAPADYSLIFRNYGKNAVLGPVEPHFTSAATLVASHEIFVLIDVVGKTESIAKTVCGVAKQFFLHLRYPGILCTSGNVAHPFSPDVMPAGAVYEVALAPLEASWWVLLSSKPACSFFAPLSARPAIAASQVVPPVLGLAL